MKLSVFHCEQPDGSWVATCEQVPGWSCFGESLAATHSSAEASLVEFIEAAEFDHFEVRAMPEAA